MEKERYNLRCGIFLLLTKEEDGTEYILLQKRQNTGVLDNLYDLACSGHLEKDETAKEAIIREAKEEIGIDINSSDLKYVSMMHTKLQTKDLEYIFIIFKTCIYKGTLTIKEPDKCSELKWFEINNLPTDIIDTRKRIINNYQNNTLYDEFGFKREDD